MKEIYRYKDLENAGWGSRVTVWRRIKKGLFPTPHDDGSGKPIWFKEDIEDWKQSLKSKEAA